MQGFRVPDLVPDESAWDINHSCPHEPLSVLIVFREETNSGAACKNSFRELRGNSGLFKHLSAQPPAEAAPLRLWEPCLLPMFSSVAHRRTSGCLRIIAWSTNTRSGLMKKLSLLPLFWVYLNSYQALLIGLFEGKLLSCLSFLYVNPPSLTLGVLSSPSLLSWLSENLTHTWDKQVTENKSLFWGFLASEWLLLAQNTMAGICRRGSLFTSWSRRCSRYHWDKIPTPRLGTEDTGVPGGKHPDPNYPLLFIFLCVYLSVS